MEDFDTLLKRSAEHHGHLCAGQVIGVRMAMLGCRLIGIEDPQKDIKKLIVYTEIDRCASDAIGSVTGCKLGRRSLKFTDYGIMAATFLNLETGQAVRVCSTESSRELAKKYAPQIKDTRKQQLHAYRVMPLSELFTVQDVKVNLSELDMPGPTQAKAVCEICGATVRDGKEVIIEGRIHCRPCAGDSYYVPLKTRVVEDDSLN
ncbi:MAG: formylmethanofuran dehydrogenase [Firmicutes bacterium]|nr:formylmethanofuran dehydrogenase [Bacillota bacterium]